MSRTLRTVLIWGLTLLVFGIWNKTIEAQQAFWIEISPMSLFRLNTEIVKALGVTFAASIAAWVIGVFGGYAAGILGAFTVVDPRDAGGLAKFGTFIDNILGSLYIIPFVLTVSMMIALVFPPALNGTIPLWSVTFALIAAAGLALGGYHVYRSIFRSVHDAKTEDRQLVEGLFLRRKSDLGRKFSKIKKLRDCRIDAYTESIMTAFHLSIVAVMIAEMVTPQLYEYVWGATGRLTGSLGAWAGGVGRNILVAQSTNQYQVIAGCIWAVVFFDSVFTELIRFTLNRRYLRYYKGDS